MHDLVCKKCVFPYAYVYSFRKLKEKSYRQTYKFYDNLRQAGCTEKSTSEQKKYETSMSVKI